MMNVLSRHNEFQADRYAASKGYAIPMRQALLKLSVSNKGMLWPDAWYASWHYSHPPVVQRIEGISCAVRVVRCRRH